MHLFSVFAAATLAPALAAQQPSVEFVLTSTADARVNVAGLEPGTPVILELGLQPLQAPVGSPSVHRAATLTGVAGELGDRSFLLPGLPASLVGGSVTVHAHGLAAGGASWTGTSALIGAGVQRLEPVFTEQGQSKLPPTAENMGGAYVAVGDLDGNGSPDLVLAEGQTLHAWVQGAGGLSDRSLAHFVQPGHAVGPILLADLDGDGDQDLVVAGDPASGQPDRIWYSQFGLRTPGPALPFASSVPTSGFVAADLNGSGRLDLLVLRGDTDHATVGERDSLYLQSPSGVFQESASFAAATWNGTVSATTSAVAADFDGDGDRDLFLSKADPASSTGSPGAQNLLLFNQGAGVFADVSSSRLVPHAKDNSYQAAVADVDGDGDPDLLVANSLLSVGGGASSDVLINQGGAQGGTAGIFFDGPGLLPEAPPTFEALRLSVVAADFNLDGLGDVFFGVHDLPPGLGGQPLFLGEVAGGGPFERVDQFQTGTFIAAGVAAFDLEGDGDIDLCVTSGGSAGGGATPARTRLYVNGTL